MKERYKKLQENLYPNFTIKQLGENKFEGTTTALCFTENNKKYNAYFVPLTIQILGSPESLKVRLREFVERVMLYGRPNEYPYFTQLNADGTRFKTPFYKTITKDEVKNHFKKCNVLLSGELEI